MANGTPQDLSGEGLRAAASETVREGTDIRAKVHELTLLALNSQRFDRHGMREVIRAVTEGAATGAEKTTTDMRLAMSEALRGHGPGAAHLRRGRAHGAQDARRHRQDVLRFRVQDGAREPCASSRTIS